MSKKLEETFNLRSEEQEESHDLILSDEEYVSEEEPEEIQIHSKEMDDIYEQATKAHKETLDLAYSVDTKLAAGILGASSSFLDLALRASKSKIDNKLRYKKMEMDFQTRVERVKPVEVDGELIDQNKQEGELLSRNDVLSRIHEIMNKDIPEMLTQDKEDKDE